ncbi:sulfate and thiosulfate binding protein CysP [Geminocystis sp. NIES-3708]|uniref:sulfate ABC transporter substrate-binding protein n=1 Tax=Geminocystis sp. NIES-3708 TaxID=1615909 RepID=UPI0005FCA7C3|nr:sulfate ABC transporter substrate-binding protein [Geminocystis sp. NIES-3708]BAQ60949.1 sulfate and thiosulfate binding protein CysP [Geminocystis sp. NIES-3708]
MLNRRYVLFALSGLIAQFALPALAQKKPKTVELTLVSYAVAKPVFSKLIPEFQKEWKSKTGQDVTFKESYGASAAQTRAVLGGLEADILAQNLQEFITPLVEKKLVNPNWSKRLPNGASPASSVMVLITRAGNPKKIKTWKDLTRDGVEIVAINPKTSGNARWGALAGYGAIWKTEGEAKANTYFNAFVKNIKNLVNSGREATDTFVKNRVGDVLINFENEIIFTNDAIPKDFPYVAPSPNLRVDFPVTVIDSVVDKRGTRQVAEAFTKFLFTPKAQAIYAQAGYRPIDEKIRKANEKDFLKVSRIYNITDFGGWPAVNKRLFDDGALFDRALQAARK